MTDQLYFKKFFTTTRYNNKHDTIYWEQNILIDIKI